MYPIVIVTDGEVVLVMELVAVPLTVCDIDRVKLVDSVIVGVPVNDDPKLGDTERVTDDVAESDGDGSSTPVSTSDEGGKCTRVTYVPSPSCT
jgi:hypothetical protein